jgi:hypothetical protein
MFDTDTAPLRLPPLRHLPQPTLAELIARLPTPNTGDLVARLREAQKQKPPMSFDHIHDPAWWWRLEERWAAEHQQFAEQWFAEHPGDDDAEPVEVQRRKRRPSVASVICQMKRAGVEVAACEVQRDGSIRIITGRPGETPDNNNSDEWDSVLQ